MFFVALTPLLPEYADKYDLSKAGAGVLAAAALARASGRAPERGCDLALRRSPDHDHRARGQAVTTFMFATGESIWVLDASRFVQGFGSAPRLDRGLSWLVSETPARRADDRHGHGDGDRRRPLRPSPGRRRLGRRRGGRVRRRRPARDHTCALGADDARAAADPAAAPQLPARSAAEPPDRPRNLVRRPPGSLLRNARGACAAPTRRSRLERGRDRDLCGSGPPRSRPRPTRSSAGPTSVGFRRCGCRCSPGHGGGAPALAEPAAALAALVVLAGTAFGSFWTPAMSLLTDEAERRGLEYAYAFALINLAWARDGARISSGGARSPR